MEILHIATIAVLVTGATAWLLWEFWGNLRGDRDAIERDADAAGAIPPWLARDHPESPQPSAGPVARPSGRMAATPFPRLNAEELPVFGRTAQPHQSDANANEPQPRPVGGGGRPHRLVA